MKTCCVWCWKPIKVDSTYDELKHKAVCSRGCKDAENLFCKLFSDEMIHRLAHYRQLTRGDRNGQD